MTFDERFNSLMLVTNPHWKSTGYSKEHLRDFWNAAIEEAIKSVKYCSVNFIYDPVSADDFIEAISFLKSK